MKSRISFFNSTALRKDITRFAPVWVLYFVLLVMALVMILDEGSRWFVSNVGYSINVFPVGNCLFALLLAQLLFGDLFNSRMCNALHAMPLRRESWFVTHVLSGFLFSFVPNGVMSLILMPLLGEHWTLALWWLLGGTLSFLFFYGLAVFCVFCVGNRFAMALVYAIINFFSLIAGWFVDTLYIPLLKGVSLNLQIFHTLCPVVAMSDAADYVWVEYIGEVKAGRLAQVTIGTAWGYMAVCAVIGIALCLGGLALYRKRKLECAGDFMAVRWMEPVFLVVYTLCAGAVFQMFGELFSGTGMGYLFLVIGVAIGFFTGQMLLKRTLRVFSGKILVGFAALAAALGLSLGLTYLDPLGITRYVPDVEDIKSVRMLPDYWNGWEKPITDPEDIEIVTQAHRLAIPDQAEPDNGGKMTLYFEYELKNGRRIEREYRVWGNSEAAQLMEPYFSSVEYVLGIREEELDSLASQIDHIWVDSVESLEVRGEAVAELLAAIAADCKAGNMAVGSAYHEEASAYWLSVSFKPKLDPENGYSEVYRYLDIRVWRESENTVKWLEDHGCTSYLDEKYEEEIPPTAIEVIDD